MGRVFIAAVQGGLEEWQSLDLISNRVIESQLLILIRDFIVQQLRSSRYETLAVPDELLAPQAIEWINSRARPGDVALDLHTSASSDPTNRGATLFYIAQNDRRRVEAEQLMQGYLRRLPQMPSRGARPDTQTSGGSIPFCRQVGIPALRMEIGFLTNPEDLQIIQAQRQEVALGIAEGVAAWSRTVSQAIRAETASWKAIDLDLNGSLFPGEGIIVNGDGYVPLDLVDQLGIDLSVDSSVRRIKCRNIVYARAVDLRDFNLSVHAEPGGMLIRSPLRGYPDQIDRIIGQGMTSEVQLMMFLKSNNPDSLTQFYELPKLYREEANIEGVNYDIAFAQMCLETSFLRFGEATQPEQNNFAGLGGVGTETASFLDIRIGVRAHIQRLKGYASSEPLVQSTVDPRFHFIRRGSAPRVEQLSRRWSADPQYAHKLKSTIRLLYESAGFL